MFSLQGNQPIISVSVSVCVRMCVPVCFLIIDGNEMSGGESNPGLTA